MTRKYTPNSIIKKCGFSFLAVVLAATSIVAMSPVQSSAASNFPRPLNVCGSSYRIVGSYWMTSEVASKFGKKGTRTGVLEVYWSNSAKKNCVIARAYGPTSGVYMTRTVGVVLSNVKGDGRSWASNEYDRGRYKSYAGPVYTKAQTRSSCIDVAAYFGPNGGGEWGSVGLDSVHCG